MMDVRVVKNDAPPLHGQDSRLSSLYSDECVIMFNYHEIGVVPRKEKSFVSKAK